MNNYKLTSKLLVRTPLLPLETITEIRNENQLRLFFTVPLNNESLFISSPSLHSEMERWVKGELKDQTKIDKLKHSLTKYLIRMSSRCTPFGLSAGIALLNWDKETNINFSRPHDLQRHTRLDMYLAAQISSTISQHPDIKKHLIFYTNSTLYKHFNAIRFVEKKQFGVNLKYAISEIEVNEYIQKALDLAKKGESIRGLASSIADHDVEFDDAYAFIEDIVDNQLLISELEPNVTGEDLFIKIKRVVNRINNVEASDYTQKVLDTLYTISQQIYELDNLANSDPLTPYDEILRQLKRIDIEIDKKFLVRIDLIKRTHKKKISYKLAGDLRKGLKILNALSPKTIESPTLNRFRERFVARYGHKEVALLEVLDNESGIGYIGNEHQTDPTPLIDDIPLGGVGASTRTVEMDDLDIFLNTKFIEAVRNNSYNINLNDKDLEHFDSDWDNFPDSLAVLGTFISANSIFIKLLTGHGSASGMLGRFTTASDDIKRYVKTITDHEQNISDKLLAEIVHLPQSRLGNVLTRERLRDYEIPFLAQSSSSEEHQIKLDDLYIKVHENGQITLRCHRLNKEVLPRLASAHNFSTDSLPIYHFLADLQMQNKQKGIFFNWANNNTYPFRPRVSYKNIVLSRAEWIFKSTDLKVFNKRKFIDLVEVENWRKEWKIPQYVMIIESDQELLIDLCNNLHLDLMKTFVDKKDSIQLSEFLFDTKNPLIKDVDNNIYTNEFVATFVKDAPHIQLKDQNYPTTQKSAKNVKSKFTLGSEWLYLKIYTGTRSADDVLTTYLYDLIDEFQRKGVITCWFFIRYNDPQFHIRIRFKLADVSLLGKAIIKVNNTLEYLLNEKVVSNIKNDIYERELDRYGRNSMETCEQLFQVHSLAILKAIKCANDSSNEEVLKLLFCILSIDDLYEGFGLKLEERQRFAQKSLKQFESEFNANSVTYKVLSQKYNYFKPFIEEVLSGSKLSLHGVEEEWTEIQSIVKQQSEQHKEPLAKLALFNKEKKLQVNYEQLVWSIIHMFTNRLFTSKQRKHEFLMYSLLNRFYQGQLKRQNDSY